MNRIRGMQVGLLLASLCLGFPVSLQAQVEWTVHPSPVLDVGEPGSWDDHGAGITAILYEGGEYKAWYNGYGADDVGRMGYATSADGIAWVKDTLNNPVLDLGPPGAFDSESIDHACVLKVGSTYHMWYSAEDFATNRIGHASSTDGVTWVKSDAHNPVVNTGLSGSWEGSEVFHASVHHDGSTFHMWYNGYGQSAQRTGYATSSDGLVWTKDDVNNPVMELGAPGEFDDFQLAVHCVIFRASKYMMWYGGGDGFAGDMKYYRIGYATSPDGVVWTRHANNPVLDVGASGDWDSVAVIPTAVLYDTTESVYKMWYGGLDGATARTGYAISSPSTGIGSNITEELLPGDFSLLQNYPNPFNPSTVIEFNLKRGSHVSLSIFNSLGQRISELINEKYPAGTHQIMWNGESSSGQSVSTGIYFYRLVTEDFVDTKKMTLIK